MEFIHPVLNIEIEAIGGHYMITHEDKLSLFDNEILYFVGYAVTDRACCGVGGCGYAIVAGCIIDYKSGLTDDGRPISIIEPVHKKWYVDITRKIQKKEGVTQVHFQCANGDRNVLF